MAAIRSPLIPLLLLSVATAAQATAPPAADDQVICKSVERPASRFRHRLCGTRAQWDRLEEQHKALYSEMQNRPAIMIGK